MYQYMIRVRSPAEVKYHKLCWTENQFSNFYQIDNSLKQFEKVKKWSNILISFKLHIILKLEWLGRIGLQLQNEKINN